MEWLLEKMIEKAAEMPDTYSPETIKQMLDTHQEAIIFFGKISIAMVLLFSLLIIGLAINNEWDHWKLKKRVEILEKNSKKGL